jgi:hypothetical protein
VAAGYTVCLGELEVGDDAFALVARGPAAKQLSGARPGDVLRIDGQIVLHDNLVAGRKQKVLTINVAGVTIEWRRPRP